jgi:ribulose-5-phosphate 4-epimerase/fuculose-1-phosphate aldolase
MTAARDDELRDEIVALGASLFERRLTFGRTGNLSVRIGDEMLVTPTSSSLGTLAADGLARVRVADAAPVGGAGPAPSKEAFLHAALYRARPDARAVVHLHSPNAVAVSCLADVDESDALPPLTAYYVMRVGRLPLLPYVAPGDPALGPVAERAATNAHALLLANHGPIVAGRDLASAADAMEELEATAGLYLALRALPTRALTPDQVADLERRVRPA